ncbi:hypothetical protein [Streptomyces sp. NPDC058545]|uniref:hypothetical protein n=1 Tax=Streptomyces sp. NPDC058545 TaxID=3346544 RepID=UPI00365CC494
MTENPDFPSGNGLSSDISVSLTARTLHAICKRVGKHGVSAYLEMAARRQLERDNLDELLADFEGVAGSADPSTVADKRAKVASSPPEAGAAG